MLDLKKTRINDSQGYELADNQSVIEEGIGLVITIAEDGRAKAKPGTGAASEIFAAVSLNTFVRPGVSTKVESLVIPATPGPYTVELAKTPLSPTTKVSARLANGTILAYGSAANAGQFEIAGTTVTFNAAEQGATVILTYSYELTVNEARALVGDTDPGTANALINRVSGIRKGEVYTDQFDTGADWTEDNIVDIICGANGIFQRGGTGAAVKGFVQEVPTIDSPFLGLYIDA